MDTTGVEDTASLLARASGQRRSSRLDNLAVISLTVLGFAAAFTYVWDFDTFWHLACGEWMFRHHKVMGYDYFSIAPESHWVNVHWFFQVVLTAVYKITGESFGAISVLTGLVSAGGMLAFALALRKKVPAGWMLFCGVLALYVMQSRLRMRPELFTLGLLTITLALADSVRRGGSPNRLWWMVPINIFWVNTHGLYFLGLVILWTMWLGSLLDALLRRWWMRRSQAGQAPQPGQAQPGLAQLGGNLLTTAALAPILAATVACLISPWPIEAATHFMTLSTRISGGDYTRGVTELQPTYEVFRFYVEGIFLVILTLGAMLASARKLSIGHVGVLAVFLVLGLMARRNVGLLAPIAAYMLAIYGACVLKDIARLLPNLSRVATPFLLLMTAAALALSTGYLTGAIPRFHHHGPLPGPGLQTDTLNINMARFLADLPAEGDILCENFGDAGPFLYYSSHNRDNPRRLMYMDGRLEAHSLQRFRDINAIRNELSWSDSAEEVVLPESVRFIVVRYDAEDRLTALMNTPRFRLIYVDIAGACFQRMDWNGGQPGRTDDVKMPVAINLTEFDLPLLRDGRIENSRQIPYRWYRQNPPPMDYQLGTILLVVGQQATHAKVNSATPDQRKCILLAARYLSAALAAGDGNCNQFRGMLAQAFGQRAMQEYFDPSRTIPIDINAAVALHLYSRINLNGLDGGPRQVFSMQWILTLLQAGHLDEAQSLIARLIAAHPGAAPKEYVDIRNQTSKKLKQAKAVAVTQKVYDLPLLERAAMLGSPKYSLVNEAIRELDAASDLDAQGKLLLGDLWLRKGCPDKARAIYGGIKLPGADQWQLTLRGALCDWVEGRCFEASDTLKALAAQGRQSLVLHYLVTLSEQLGDYDTYNRYRTDAGLKELLDKARETSGETEK